jgi:hypothetical protein
MKEKRLRKNTKENGGGQMFEEDTTKEINL